MNYQKIPYIDIHSHHEGTLNEGLRIFNAFLNHLPPKTSNKVSVGLHPWHCSQLSLKQIKSKLINAIDNHKAIAIGETGLDFYTSISRELQEQVFNIHIEVALQYKLPLILHVVKAQNEALKQLKNAQFDLPFIFHAFQGNQQQTQQIIEMNGYLSVGQRTLQKGEKGIETIKAIPLDRLFIESDEHEKSIEDLYFEIAKIKEVSVNYLKKLFLQNYKKVFT